MSKKFECPNCSKHNIEFVEEGFIRISNVVKVLAEENVEQSFLYSLSAIKQPPRTISHYRCTDCKHVLGSSVKFIRDRFFIENIKKPWKATNYKVKEISHCSGDTPTVREHTDLLNLLIRDCGGAITVVNDSSEECIKTQKLIRERPYLFEKKYDL